MLRFLAATSILFALAACETVEGFGQDVQTGGQAIEQTAVETQDDL